MPRGAASLASRHALRTGCRISGKHLCILLLCAASLTDSHTFRRVVPPCWQAGTRCEEHQSKTDY